MVIWLCLISAIGPVSASDRPHLDDRDSLKHGRINHALMTYDFPSYALVVAGDGLEHLGIRYAADWLGEVMSLSPPPTPFSLIMITLHHTGNAEDSLDLEAYQIKTTAHGDTISIDIYSSGELGLVYGLYYTARQWRIGVDQLLETTTYRKPAYPVRMVYTEHAWIVPSQRQWYRELFQSIQSEGYNWVTVRSLLDRPIPEFPGLMAQYAAADRELVEVVRLAHDMGLKVAVLDIVNMVHPEVSRKYPGRVPPGYPLDDIVCPPEHLPASPTSPDVRTWFIESRTPFYQTVAPHVDAISWLGADPGECPSTPSGPSWWVTYADLVSDYIELARSFNPDVLAVPFLWGITAGGLADYRSALTLKPDDAVGWIESPHTHMEIGKYLTIDPRSVDELKKLAEEYPIVLQLFLDGVGFKDTALYYWENPMPIRLREALNAFSDIDLHGVTAKPTMWELQRVDLRLIGEWLWQPHRSARQILSDFANEQFGPGTGEAFADAMFAMERWWDTENGRMFVDRVTLAQRETIQRALQVADIAVQKLEEVQRIFELSPTRILDPGFNVRTLPTPWIPAALDTRTYLEGFLYSAMVMQATSKQYLLRIDAQDESLSLDARREKLLEALAISEDIVELMRATPRLRSLIGPDSPNTRWWEMGQRPANIRLEIEELGRSRPRGYHLIDDPVSFGTRWVLENDPAMGRTRAELSSEAAYDDGGLGVRWSLSRSSSEGDYYSQFAYRLRENEDWSAYSGMGLHVRSDAQIPVNLWFLIVDGAERVYSWGTVIPAHSSDDWIEIRVPFTQFVGTAPVEQWDLASINRAFIIINQGSYQEDLVVDLDEFRLF